MCSKLVGDSADVGDQTACIDRESMETPQQRLDSLRARIKTIESENELLQYHYDSLSPQTHSHALQDDFCASLEGDPPVGAPESLEAESVLTVGERQDIVNQELNSLQEQVRRCKNEGEDRIEQLRSRIEACSTQDAETSRDMFEFRRNFLGNGASMHSGDPAPERVDRYIQHKVDAKSQVIEKLHARNATLTRYLRKMQRQLAQKEELGETLHVVDFDQLQIENEQCLRRIRERNEELLGLKLATSKSAQGLLHLKSRLAKITSSNEWLRSEIQARQEQVKKLIVDSIQVKSEKQAAHQRRAIPLEEKEGAPQVLEYIKVKAEVAELERKKGNWERKIEIAALEARGKARPEATADTPEFAAQEMD
eukprot:scaffold625_cov420-Prasinococcus_capsulatus_cf.AAC.63